MDFCHKNLGHPQDSNSQNGNPLETDGIHSLAFSHTFENVFGSHDVFPELTCLSFNCDPKVRVMTLEQN